MGEHTDKASGRVKQAAGALTGDDDTKREGEREEHKGEIKERVNDAADATKDAIDDVKKKITRS
jgi:uncharacterized protein YjbJ (UPF0337 family)